MEGFCNLLVGLMNCCWYFFTLFLNFTGTGILSSGGCVPHQLVGTLLMYSGTHILAHLGSRFS